MTSVRAFATSDAEAVQYIMATCTCELRAVYVPKPQVDSLSKADIPIMRVVAVDHTDAVVGVAEYIARPLSLYVQGIAVSPMYRRRGVAGALLDYIAKLAVNMGHPAVEVATIKETGNVEIFKHLGLSVIEERTSERFLGLHGQSVTEVTLKRYVPHPSLEGI